MFAHHVTLKNIIVTIRNQKSKDLDTCNVKIKRINKINTGYTHKTPTLGTDTGKYYTTTNFNNDFLKPTQPAQNHLENQCCGSGSGRIRSFLPDPDPVKNNRIRIRPQ